MQIEIEEEEEEERTTKNKTSLQQKVKRMTLNKKFFYETLIMK